MAKTISETQKELNAQWEKVCSAYLKTLSVMWCMDLSYGYWIDEKIGGIYSYEDMFIGFDNIKYCVDNSIDEEEFRAWLEYMVECSTFDFQVMDFDKWHDGSVKRIPQEVLDRLNELKNKFDKEWERVKEEMKNGKNSY